MTDELKAVGAGLTVLGSRDLLNKLLGPSFDYVGVELRGFIEKCNLNLGEVLRRAVLKLGDRVEEPGGVNPRVTRQVVDEARFCEDSLFAEYFGGILASARSPEAKDDRAVIYVRAIRSLSVYDLRTHYLFYRCLRAAFRDTSLELENGSDRRRARLYVPLRSFLECIEVHESEKVGPLLPQITGNLKRSALIGSHYAYGSTAVLKEHGCKKAPEPGVVLQPSVFGIQMYLWAHGYSDRSPGEFLSSELDLDSRFELSIPRGIRCVPATGPNPVEAVPASVNKSQEIEGPKNVDTPV